MNFFKLALVSVALLGTSLSSIAFAIDLYVDTKTKQIFTEPGAGRVHLGTFKRDDSATNQQVPSAANVPQPQRSHVVTEESRPSATAPVQVSKSKFSPPSNEASVTLDSKGLRFKSADGNFKFKLGGRIHADSSFHHGDNFMDANGNPIEANDGTEIRRGRMVFQANFFKDWDYITQVDFADNQVSVKDMSIKYKGLGFMEVVVGQHKQAFSRELQESSNDLLFIERSLATAITGTTVDRAIGLNLFSYNDTTTAQLGIYGDTVAANKRKTHADEGWSVSSRITHAPLYDPKGSKIINLGINGNYRKPDDAGDVSGKPLKLATESTHMSNLNLVSASISNVDNYKMIGGDATAVFGPVSFGGEYTHIWIDRKNGEPSLAFNGWFGEAAWSLTGESRNFKKGEFNRISPTKEFSFSKGTWGAWELAVRYSEVDLNHHQFKGGEMALFSVGLNWYINQNVRLMAGYDKTLNIKDSPLRKRDGRSPDNMDTFLFRTQLAF